LVVLLEVGGWLASGLFLATVFYLALVALFAVTPLTDIGLALGNA
jgi:hypothetical protein